MTSMNNQAKKRIMVQMPADLHYELKILAAREISSISAIVRRLISQELAAKEEAEGTTHCD